MSVNRRGEARPTFRSPSAGIQRIEVHKNLTQQRVIDAEESLNLPRPFPSSTTTFESNFFQESDGRGQAMANTQSSASSQHGFEEYGQEIAAEGDPFFRQIGNINFQKPIANLGPNFVAPVQHAMQASASNLNPSATKSSSIVSTFTSHSQEDNTHYSEEKETRLCCSHHACNKSFTRKDHLKRHVDTVHGTLKICCSFCQLHFRDKSDLKRHCQNAHGKKEFRCDTPGCGKMFKSSDSLQSHKASVHKEGNIFQCEVVGCGKAFSHKHLLDGHKVCHTATKNAQCMHCSKEFAYKHNMIRHQNRCAGNFKINSATDASKEFTCQSPGCDACYSDARSLSRHTEAKHGEMRRRHVCKNCKRLFSYSSSLSRHTIGCKTQAS
eukprot:gene1313-1458_t